MAQARCVAVLLVVALAGPVGGRPPGGTQYTVIVGVTEYANDSGLPSLQFAVNDANALADVLGKAGYEVTLLVTGGRAPTGEAIRAALQTLKAKWKPDDTLIV